MWRNGTSLLKKESYDLVFTELEGQKDRGRMVFLYAAMDDLCSNTIPSGRCEKKSFKSTVSVMSYHLIPVNQDFLSQTVFPWFPWPCSLLLSPSGLSSSSSWPLNMEFPRDHPCTSLSMSLSLSTLPFFNHYLLLVWRRRNRFCGLVVDCHCVCYPYIKLLNITG